jgi:hypothetical protein
MGAPNGTTRVMVGLRVNRLELDELWSYVANLKRQKPRPRRESFGPKDCILPPSCSLRRRSIGAFVRHRWAPVAACQPMPSPYTALRLRIDLNSLTAFERGQLTSNLRTMR